MNGAVFVDSAAWIALLHSADSLHARAVVEYKLKIDEGRLLVTTSMVLVEVASAFSAPARRHLAVELDRRYRETRIGEIVWIGKELYERSWQLYRERSDKGWSLVDCASFIVMQDRGITEALTSDHHFEQAGFKTLL
jgi:predicted nucleic acid-binding protein